MAEVRASKNEAQAKAGDLAGLEMQLHRAQEQLRAAREEASQLQAALALSVPRSELDLAKAKAAESEAHAQAARDGVQEKIKEWELEASKTRAVMQVLASCRMHVSLTKQAERAFHELRGVRIVSCGVVSLSLMSLTRVAGDGPSLRAP